MRRRRSAEWRTVFLAAAALWFIVDAGAEVVQEVRLRSGAETGRAVVLEKDAPYGRRNWGRRFERAFNTWLLRGHASETYVVYRLTLADGTSVTREAPVSRRRWNMLEEGSMLEVRYLGSDPDVNRPAGEGALWLALIRLAIGAFLGLIAVGGAVIWLRQGRSESESPAPS